MKKKFAVIYLACLLALFGQAQTSWVTVRDGRESAFSVDIPKGWKSYGGMFRFGGGLDARPFVDMTSPDGRINLRIGDATIPPYTTPNARLRSAHAEGPHVAPYATGDFFATKYGQARFRSMCQALQLKTANAMAPKYHQPGGGPIRVTAGQATFSCTANGQPMSGFVYAETLLMSGVGPQANWSVIVLGSFLAPASQAQEAGALLKHSGESLALNPAWEQMEKRLVDQSTRNIIGLGQAEHQRQQRMMHAMDRENENFNDVIRGVAFTRDSQTGKEWEVPLGTGGTQWVNGNAAVVESAFSPGPAFHQLETISR